MKTEIPALESYKGFAISIVSDGGFYHGTVRREDGRRFSALVMTERTFTAFDLPSLAAAISLEKVAIDNGDYD